MKIKKSNKNKKIILISLTAVLILVAGYTTFAYINHLWPFPQENETAAGSEKNERSNKKSEKNSTKPDENQVEKEDQSINEDTPATEQSDNDSSSGDDSRSNGGYINPPLLNPPAQNDPYPIENERYRIAQNSPTNFDVTLYPVVNNAEHSNYNAQLKAYKNEVLDYLRKRHGDTNKLSIQWRPSDAQNL